MAFSFVHEYDAQTFGGACFSCGAPRRNTLYNPTGERLIDLGPIVDTVMDLEGNIHGFKKPVICETCVRELTVMIGGTVADQIDRDNIEHWKARALSAEKEMTRLTNLFSRIQQVKV
jgi:hypothetical protein